ncbi:hypothetical protein BDV95DRAFT_672993 [Massariosphaeria phaeospora]|uniref:Uncharacterized protein n=1 Tax=Massariosphaeria phaeospora TaxID=100035 RepID=A0A7C8MAZ7_9PLEO|nr:hypothetical protein BDV95DRAFT_672993 [Massariosphaeria phaeospora]
MIQDSQKTFSRFLMVQTHIYLTTTFPPSLPTYLSLQHRYSTPTMTKTPLATMAEPSGPNCSCGYYRDRPFLTILTRRIETVVAAVAIVYIALCVLFSNTVGDLDSWAEYRVFFWACYVPIMLLLIANGTTVLFRKTQNYYPTRNGFAILVVFGGLLVSEFDEYERVNGHPIML